MPRSRATVLALLAMAGTALLFVVVNADLPILRNSLLYAKSARHLIEGTGVLNVISDQHLSYGKPVGFALLLTPFDFLFGDNLGPKVGSFVSGLFFLLAAALFFRRCNARIGVSNRLVPLELALLFVNPLVPYEFWSAYPDLLFGALVLLVVVVTDVIANEADTDCRVHIVGLGVLIYLAALTKLYGMVLVFACPACLLAGEARLRRGSTHRKAELALLVLVFGSLAGAFVLARFGFNPTLSFHPAGDALDGGYSHYLSTLRYLPVSQLLEVVIDSVLAFLTTIVVCAGVALVFVRTGRGIKPLLGTIVLCAIFVAGLLPFPSTDSNMRYYVPVLPLLVAMIARGIQYNKAPRAAVTVLGLHFAIATFLMLDYNIPAVHERLQRFNDSVIAPLDTRRSQLDNLRLGEHLRLAESIATINRTMKPGESLHWISHYYRDGTYGFGHTWGIRDDIVISYHEALDSIPGGSGKSFCVFFYPDAKVDLGVLKRRYQVTALREDLVRVVPRSVPRDGR